MPSSRPDSCVAPAPKTSIIPTIGGPYFALAVLFGMNLLNYIDRYSFFAVGTQIKRDLTIDDKWYGVLGGSFMIVYTLVSPLMGWLGDRYNRRMLLAGGVAIWSLATVGTAFSADFYRMFFWRALLGVREASYGVIAPALLADSKERPPEEHVVEVRGERCPHGRQAPDGHSASQQHPAAVAISQPSHQRRYERVHDHERPAEHPVPLVIDRQIALDLRADREERVTVDVVQQIHAEQDRQREIGATDGGNDAGFGGSGDRGVRTGRRHREAASPGISRTVQTNRYTRFTLDWRDPWISNNRAAAFVS